ncbi:MAG: glucose 1-dehydrogenase [Ruminiclostridium sp.]|nr:glucose 1-dehydrogenase [Ruminiclostridium sp.]
MRLQNKVAVITGGGSGIGRAAALLLAKEGAKVVIAGRRHKPLEETVDLIKSAGGDAICLSIDVSKTGEVKKMIDVAVNTYRKIDILYNNAAVFTGTGKNVVELDEDEWDDLMDTNLKGVFLCCKYVIPHMINNGGGSIINCSSISGHLGQRRQGAYNAAKGGIEMLSKCMALDFAEYKIRVNTVCPAWVETDFNREDVAKRKDEVLKLHPAGRIGQPEDVAYAVLYLASDESAWVTGTSLMVDGGYTAQ